MRHKLYEIFNMIKGFEAGYTSKSDNKLILDYDGDRYILTLEKIDNPSDDMLKDIDKYLR